MSCSRTSLSLVKVDTAVPAAACHQSSLIAKVDTAVPAAACHQTSLIANQANLVTSMPIRSRLPTPVNQAAAVIPTSTRSRLPILANRANKTSPVLPEHTQRRSLTANLAAPLSDAVTARIQKRHQLTAAKLTAAKRSQPPVKKATAPASAPVLKPVTPSTPKLRGAIPAGVPTFVPCYRPALIPVERPAFRASTAGPNIQPSIRKYVFVHLAFTGQFNECWYGHISHKVAIPATIYTRPTLIPLPPDTPSTITAPRIRPVVAPASLRPVFLPRRPLFPRGTSPYCGRYCRLGSDGKPFVPSWELKTRHGYKESCRHEDRARAVEWATTPAEEGVGSTCSHTRRVHWKPQIAEVVETFEPWNVLVWGATADPDYSAPPRYLPPMPSPPPSPPPSPSPTEPEPAPKPKPAPKPEPAPPADTNFHDTWTALMAEAFDDDLDC